MSYGLLNQLRKENPQSAQDPNHYWKLFGLLNKLSRGDVNWAELASVLKMVQTPQEEMPVVHAFNAEPMLKPGVNEKLDKLTEKYAKKFLFY